MKLGPQRLKTALLAALLVGVSTFASIVAAQQDDAAPSFEESSGEEVEADVKDDELEEVEDGEDGEEPVDAEPETTTETASEEPEQPQVNPDASFTPTEEISEDKPVAFPVDI